MTTTLGLILGITSAPALSAASVSAFAFSQSTNAGSPPTYFCFFSPSCDGSVVVTTVNGGVARMNYRASSSADYGVLRAFAQQSFVDANGAPPTVTTNNSYLTVGEARFRDVFDIVLAQGVFASTGYTNTMTFFFDVTGTFSATDSFASAGISGRNYSVASAVDGTRSGTSTLRPGRIQVSLPFDPTRPNDVELWFQASVLTGIAPIRPGPNGTVDASKTAILSGLTLRDAGGNVLPFQLAGSQSGSSNYASLVLNGGTTEPSAVPEPASLWLVLGGGLVALRFRRSR